MTRQPRRALVVGPNPAMDIVLEVRGFTLGSSHRATRFLHLAGGKPLNVARALRRMNVSVCLVTPLGGALGPRRLIVDTCHNLGVELRACDVREETRTCIVVADPNTGESTVVNEPGPALTTTEADDFRQLVYDAIRPDDLVLMSGSLPLGLSADFYAGVVRQSKAVEARTIVDTSGEPLRRALESMPYAVKVNSDELLNIRRERTAERAAGTVSAGGVEVVVTLGHRGAFYAGSQGQLQVLPIPVESANPTGAGDAFLAGLCAGLIRGSAWPDALRWATVAASRACTGLDPDIGPVPNMEMELPLVDVRPYQG